jgi:hypothetical protein
MSNIGLGLGATAFVGIDSGMAFYECTVQAAPTDLAWPRGAHTILADLSFVDFIGHRRWTFGNPASRLMPIIHTISVDWTNLIFLAAGLDVFSKTMKIQ